MTATEYTGARGSMKVGGVTVATAEFGVKIDRGVGSHPRSGEWSDYNAPGKVSVTGTIKRIMINDAFLDYAYGTAGVPAVVSLIGAVTKGSDSVTITANNCIITSSDFEFTDANEIVSDNVTFRITDADADLTIALAP